MGLKDDLTTNVDEILSKRWETRDGRAVPEIETVALRGETVKLDATMLYSDLADSTALASYNREIASRCTSRVITDGGGSIRSFDGDRVMAVFVGDYKNTSAARVALKINWMFLNIIKPKLTAKYRVFNEGTFSLAQCVGIDTSEVTADITEEDCKTVEAAMTKCSTWLPGHDQAAAARAPVPGSAELKKDIDALEAWVKTVRDRRR